MNTTCTSCQKTYEERSTALAQAATRLCEDCGRLGGELATYGATEREVLSQFDLLFAGGVLARYIVVSLLSEAQELLMMRSARPKQAHQVLNRAKLITLRRLREPLRMEVPSACRQGGAAAGAQINIALVRVDALVTTGQAADWDEAFRRAIEWADRGVQRGEPAVAHVSFSQGTFLEHYDVETLKLYLANRAISGGPATSEGGAL